MNINDILKKYVNFQDRERQIGRYYASEISSIVKGYSKPKDFFTARKIDLSGVRNIMSGKAFEAEFKKALNHNEIEYEHEPKRELNIQTGEDKIVIVVKPDFLLKDKLIETKFPVRLGSPTEYIDRYRYQLECEYRAFETPVYLGVFKHPFSLNFYPYKEEEKTWSYIIKTIKDFHNEVKKIHGKQR
jgi:hypothetical protein